MNTSIHDKIESLRATIRRHDALYYVHATPEISDLDYDMLMRQLQELEAAHPEFDSDESPTNSITFPTSDFRILPSDFISCISAPWMLGVEC